MECLVQDAGQPVGQHAGVGAADQMVPVALPHAGVESFVVGVEALALGGRRFEQPSQVEEVAVVHLQIATGEVVVRAHGEGADEVADQGRSLRREPLLARDVLVVPQIEQPVRQGGCLPR